MLPTVENKGSPKPSPCRNEANSLDGPYQSRGLGLSAAWARCGAQAAVAALSAHVRPRPVPCARPVAAGANMSCSGLWLR